MTAQQAYAFLMGLPGIGSKSALCVLMSSLNFDVFPVDVNVSRIAVRLGMVWSGLNHYEYQKLIPRLVPDGRSSELHVGMVVHGRSVCLPSHPICRACPIRDFCKFGQRQPSASRIDRSRNGRTRTGSSEVAGIPDLWNEGPP